MTAILLAKEIPVAAEASSTGARWLTVVSHTDPRYGGLSAAVPQAARTVALEGQLRMSLAAFCAPSEHVVPEGYKDERLSFWPVARRPWLQAPSLRRDFNALVRASDGVHIHGLWEASTAVASRTANRQNKPYVLSAHGMLEPWALAQKRWKKLAYAAVFERGIVKRAACLHALTKAEAQQYRSFGAKGTIAVIPNAVAVPSDRSPQPFLTAHPHIRGKRLVLFLGRLHPKKGLSLLAEAWALIAREFPEAHLVVAGPDDENTAERLHLQIASARIEGAVTFTGMLGRDMKWSALAASEAFVLPSFSEGLSMSVLEALGAGVPVIVTKNCNMPEVQEQGAGWEIVAEVSALQAALQTMLRHTPEQNRAMGERGADLIAKRYAPHVVAHAMAEVYRYVLDGTKPSKAELLMAGAR